MEHGGTLICHPLQDLKALSLNLNKDEKNDLKKITGIYIKMIVQYKRRKDLEKSNLHNVLGV